MKNKTICIATTVLMVTGTLGGQPSLDEANSAFFDFRVAEANKSYEEIWTSSAPGKERTDAGKQLTRICWQFYRDYERAKTWSDTLMAAEPGNFDVPYQMAGISIGAGKYGDAQIYLRESLRRANNGYQKKIACIRSAGWILSRSQHELECGKPLQTEEIREALGNLREYYTLEPENLEIARLYFGLSLLLGNRESALEAFRAYFKVPEGVVPHGILADAESLISAGLGSAAEKEKLAQGLALSRFYDLAIMTLHQYNVDYGRIPALADVVEYFEFLAETKASAFEYFRQKALGNSPDEDYIKNYYTRCIDLWGDLSWENGTPVFYEEGFEEELFKRFGTKMNTGEGGSEICFFAGHTVFHERREIEHYGRKGTITYSSLDYIVGNIYPHWYFGYFGVGGWATNKNEVMSIRTVNFNGNSPLRAFNRLTNEEEREKWLAEISEKSAQDDSVARIRPYELMEGLPERMKFQCYRRLIDSLKPLHADPAALKIHFLSSVDDILVESVIFSHEGRHVLDSYVDYPFNTEMFSWEEREFRANLSGISFSPDPKLTVAEGLFVPQDPAHENANRRIIRGLVGWMDGHQAEIAGLDPDRPLLPQLDLLTGEQIVRATRSMDPLYAEYAEQNELVLQSSK
jgi:hypothetical protein